jgi:hypothetical protein
LEFYNVKFRRKNNSIHDYHHTSAAAVAEKRIDNIVVNGSESTGKSKTGIILILDRDLFPLQQIFTV